MGVGVDNGGWRWGWQEAWCRNQEAWCRNQEALGTESTILGYRRHNSWVGVGTKAARMEGGGGRGSGGWGGLGWGELGQQSFVAWGCVGVYDLGMAFFAFSLDVYCID